jgi:hypothetical protein
MLVSTVANLADSSNLRDNLSQVIIQREEKFMKISVKRSGGFAGLTENIADVDTTQLEETAAQQVKQLVESIGFFDLPNTVAGGGLGADFFHHEITVTQGKRQHTIAFDDDNTPATAPLRKFVETLVQIG